MEILFQVKDCYARQLTEHDLEALQTLCDRCTDYSELAEGVPTPSDAAHNILLRDRPPGKTIDDKIVVGLFANPEQMIGVVDIGRDYPEPGIWFIGLFLLAPTARNRGIGSCLFLALVDWATNLGASQIRIAVLEENTKGFRFWQRLGFEVIDKLPLQQFGNKEHARFLMQYDIYLRTASTFELPELPA
jgi:RimJ/RimL family protein N-acetyltransferase